MRVLVADAGEARRQALVAVLLAEPGLEIVTPAATVREVASTPLADVVLLVGCLDLVSTFEVLREACQGGGPAWVVLTEDIGGADEIILSGAHGCLAASSTPLQIGAAIRAAARGDRAELDQPTTGPLVQRIRRDAPPLTPREIEVLRLVDAGMSTQEIAEQLYLSPSSVKSHLSHTYGRLGVRRREAAAAEARRQGLI